VLHLLAAPVGLGPTALRLDWARRFDHMQQHSAQHLLTALADDRFGWPTTAFHLGTEVADVELAVPRLAAADLRRLEEAARPRCGRAARSRSAGPRARRWEQPARAAAACPRHAAGRSA